MHTLCTKVWNGELKSREPNGACSHCHRDCAPSLWIGLHIEMIISENWFVDWSLILILRFRNDKLIFLPTSTQALTAELVKSLKKNDDLKKKIGHWSVAIFCCTSSSGYWQLCLFSDRFPRHPQNQVAKLTDQPKGRLVGTWWGKNSSEGIHFPKFKRKVC